MIRYAYICTLILGLAMSLAGGAPLNNQGKLLFPPPSTFRFPDSLIGAHAQLFQRSQLGGTTQYQYLYFATPCIQEVWVRLHQSTANAAKDYRIFVKSVETFVKPAPAGPEPKRFFPIRPPITPVEALIQTGSQNLWVAMRYRNIFLGIGASTSSQPQPSAALPDCKTTLLHVARILVSRTKAYAARQHAT